MRELEPPEVATTAKEDPEALTLRGNPQPAVRFRRKLIVGLSGAAIVVLVTLSWFAFRPSSFRHAATPLDQAEPSAKEPEALDNLPGSYGDVPRLGPSLPGDLGRPILEQQRSLEARAPTASGSFPPQPVPAEPSAQSERQRTAEATFSARTSPILIQLQGSSSRPEAPDASSNAMVADPARESPATAIAADQQHKIDFARLGGGVIDAHRLVPPASPWTLSAGSVIPASLITGLNSELPGLVLAQVTENVRDSATGRSVLIPQGARLLGRYDNIVSHGQRRALVIWNRILFPNGWSIEIDSAPATDSSGFSGVADKTDSHGWQLLRGIALSTLLGVGTQLGFGGSESGLVRAIRESAQQNAAHAGDQLTARNLEIRPTLTVRPGWPVRVIVHHDLVLQPWRDR